MKATELLKLYRDGLINKMQIEIRMENWGRKTVRYTNIEELEKEELLQHKIVDWFVGSNITDGEIVINVQNMNKIDKLKKFLKENYNGTQAFNTQNMVGDAIQTVYQEDAITVDYCYYYDYVEIFGLTNEEFESLLDNSGHISII